MVMAVLLIAFTGGPVRGQGLPDLIPSKLKIDVADTGPACDLALRLTIKNKGDADAGAYVVDVTVLRDDVELFVSPLFVPDGTAAHAKTILASGFGYTAGVYRIEIEVNRFDPIPEQDMTNNHLSSGSCACPG
jgi:hypothetical protein